MEEHLTRVEIFIIRMMREGSTIGHNGRNYTLKLPETRVKVIQWKIFDNLKGMGIIAKPNDEYILTEKGKTIDLQP